MQMDLQMFSKCFNRNSQKRNKNCKYGKLKFKLKSEIEHFSRNPIIWFWKFSGLYICQNLLKNSQIIPIFFQNLLENSYTPDCSGILIFKQFISFRAFTVLVLLVVMQKKNFKLAFLFKFEFIVFPGVSVFQEKYYVVT